MDCTTQGSPSIAVIPPEGGAVLSESASVKSAQLLPESLSGQPEGSGMDVSSAAGGIKPFGKHPNGPQKVNHEIGESYPDAPEPAQPAKRTFPEEPGDATISPPSPPTDSRSATPNPAALETTRTFRPRRGRPGLYPLADSCQGCILPQ